MNDSFTKLGETIPFCHHHECDEKGLYRAPKDPLKLQEYYWFCLKHVRAYNRQWDYYRHMTPQEIQASRHFDSLWESPTHSFNVSKVTKGMHETFSTFKNFKATPREDNHPYKPTSDEAQALKLFQLPYPFSLEILKKRYKELVKKFHPDVLGAKTIHCDDKIKDINHAYQVLKKLIL